MGERGKIMKVWRGITFPQEKIGAWMSALYILPSLRSCERIR